MRSYVYIHRKKSDGSVFYVGRGIGRRGWQKSGRNDRWLKVFKKHGRTVHIIKDDLSYECSLTLEKILIWNLRKSGVDLVNMTDGGEGVNGYRPSREERTQLSRAHGGRVVCCSNGMKFDTGVSAAEWLKDNGWPNARQGHISACCRDERTGAYGFSWWYDGEEPKDHIPRYERLSNKRHKGVYCSNGMWFKTQKLAAEWLRNNGHPKAEQSGVGQAARGVMKRAYGYEWRFGRKDESAT